MKKAGILNSDISRVLSYLGHTDRICIGDCGLPIPDETERIDLALAFGEPTFMRTLEIVAGDMNPENWYCEREAVCQNLTMISAVGGMIGVRPDGKGGEESFVAMHFVAGGAWDAPTICGHLNPGTLVKGAMQVYVTEILDMEVQYPADMKEGDPYPENFYVSTTGKPGK